jgi:serine/threonine protein kinase
MTQTEDVLDGKYKLGTKVGAGGFGSVYKAEDLGLSRPVAVKILDVLDAGDLESRARFEREAKVLSTLRHQHIVSVYNYGQDDLGRPYISMQLLQGQTLGQILAKEEKLDWKRAVAITIQVCQALAVAHKADVVHRDLKPDNIMLVSEPEPDFVKVLDFGLSGFVFGAEGAVQKLTQTGAVVGTVFYMSPEVCQGRRADTRSDIYSLGCILYQCLTGRPAMDGDDPLNVLYKQVHELPARLPSILPDLELIVFKAMQKEPAKRFQSMEEFADALNMVLTGKKGSTDFSGVKLEHAGPRNNRRLIVCIAIASLLSLVGAFFILQKTIVTSSERDAAWAQAMNEGNLKWHRNEHEQAMPHYTRALSLASNRHNLFLTQLAVARGITMTHQGSRAKLRQGMDVARQSLATAQTETEKCAARLMIGVLARENKLWDECYENLRSQPWKQISSIEDAYLRNGIFIDRAKDSLGRLLISKGIDVEYGKELLSELSAAAELPKPVKRLRILRESGNWDAMASRWTKQLRNKAIPSTDQLLAESLMYRYEIQNAQTDEELYDAIEATIEAAQKYDKDKRALGVAHTVAGIGYYELGEYDRALALLKHKPWEDIGEGNIGQDWIVSARSCFLNMELMRGGDPDTLIPQLIALRNSGRPFEKTAPRTEWFLAAAYSMSDSPRARFEVQELLKPLTTEVPRTWSINEVLYPEEQKYIKEKLTKAKFTVEMK